MIRGSDFGTNFEVKLFMSIAAILICLYDWKKKDRLDYFYVFITGTIIWSTVELILQFTGTRIIPNKLLFGIPIPLILSIPLQGISEGAAIAIYGLFGADNLIDEETRTQTLIIFAALMGGLFTYWIFTSGPNFAYVGLFVPSRRDMFTVAAVVFLGAMLAIDGYLFIKAESGIKKRAFYLTIVMIIFAAIWTLAEWIAGGRWIETGVYPLLRRATPLIEFGALAWDVIVEISLAYVPYLAIPYLLGLIKEN